MALEKRGNGFYYYKKEREGNSVVSKYYGKGNLASLIAQMDEEEREDKKFEAEKQSENLRKLEQIDTDLSEIERNVKRMTEIYLTEIGFYKTKSREWRYRKLK